MALPKFTTNPTPLYQQQPIIRRQNYGDLYMRNFAAAEATAYKSFAAIGVAIEKKREKRDRELEKELERDSLKWKAKSAGRKDRDYAEVMDRLKTLNAETKDSDGEDITSKVYSQLQGMRDDVSALPWQIAEGLITRDDAQAIEDAYNLAIDTYKPALNKLNNLRVTLRSDNMGHILDKYTKGLKEGNFKVASLVHELEDKEGYDLKFSLGGENGLTPIVSWTDDLRTNEDGSPLVYQYTLPELRDIDFFSDWDEEFSYADDDYVKMQAAINQELLRDPDFDAASRPPETRRTTITKEDSTGMEQEYNSVTRERSIGNYNQMKKKYANLWRQYNEGNTYEKWKQFHDIIVVGNSEDEYFEMATRIVEQYPEQYNSTLDNNGDGVPDDVEKLMKVIGSFNTWEDGWQENQDNANVMIEYDRILSDASFENFYSTQKYRRTKYTYDSWDIPPDETEKVRTDLTDIQKNKKRNLQAVNYLPTIMDLINRTFEVDPAVENIQTYNRMKTAIINNFPEMKKILGTKDAVWQALGDSEEVDEETGEPIGRSNITMGEIEIPVNASLSERKAAKRNMVERIIKSDPAFSGMEFNSAKFWKGFEFSAHSVMQRSGEAEEAVQYYTDWIAKATSKWKGLP
mgnify:FL=1